MRIVTGTLFLIIILLIAMPAPYISGQSSIIVNNADTTITISTGAPLVNPNIQARVVVQYGNSLHYLPVGNLPASLQALLSSVAQRASVQYANSIRSISTIVIPNTLQGLLSTVQSRISFQYANSNRPFPLIYPPFIPDAVPPVISSITHTGSSDNATIRWSTDEFSRYILRYGTQSGSYTETIEEQLYAKQHTATLIGLINGNTYYLQVTTIDRKGNQSVSSEYVFTAGPPPTPMVTPVPPATPKPPSVFLPLVRRR